MPPTSPAGQDRSPLEVHPKPGVFAVIAVSPLLGLLRGLNMLLAPRDRFAFVAGCAATVLCVAASAFVVTMQLRLRAMGCLLRLDTAGITVHDRPTVPGRTCARSARKPATRRSRRPWSSSPGQASPCPPCPQAYPSNARTQEHKPSPSATAAPRPPPRGHERHRAPDPHRRTTPQQHPPHHPQGARRYVGPIRNHPHTPRPPPTTHHPKRRREGRRPNASPNA